jgi:hypothetical protein
MIYSLQIASLPSYLKIKKKIRAHNIRLQKIDWQDNNLFLFRNTEISYPSQWAICMQRNNLISNVVNRNENFIYCCMWIPNSTF